ncbi:MULTISPECIES: NAD(P)-dependent oxidoreductase [unclassified Bosea (in: a-proteobacteria)]|uniref:NAD-dependent epimerase/dehydratase family protein n=1 Tax=unclassified Bosea (in: a-proteobacteria) TaxID=2653178 RepID=UPI000F74D7B0|nr:MULTISPECIES: NAD(P)-dependent oxidoreductase [unclassified Bosea (in: a-proteobacteria)]AZO80894.1 NAD-dependent dehydratase [Bosea sp. Tri-49]RXT25861.1 NAD-dependent dehydratase [Bosea sp. Tri-39]RXT31103.1 NAD-dependent dehydratase [Bosea sp. Tri-54]
MKHIIIGGDGFVGSHLAADLAAMGEDVLVCDIQQSAHPHYSEVPFQRADVTDPASVEAISLTPDDLVYNLSAKMLSPIVTRKERHDFFWPVNYHGTQNVLSWMEKNGANRLVHFTTDMIYGHSVTVPQDETHPAKPLGEYGESKLATETLCQSYRDKGFRIPIFRPRLIIGPGRLGILVKLFRLIDMNLPVPMIGSGNNPYQFISVFDCASACIAAWKADFPNSAYNLGSDDPPPVKKLLGDLIRHAGSKSILLPTPASLVKLTLNGLDAINLPIMDPEQYMIADEICILDTSKAKRELGWAPQHRDEDMLMAAYTEYRKAKDELRRKAA